MKPTASVARADSAPNAPGGSHIFQSATHQYVQKNLCLKTASDSGWSNSQTWSWLASRFEALAEGEGGPAAAALALQLRRVAGAAQQGSVSSACQAMSPIDVAAPNAQPPATALGCQRLQRSARWWHSPSGVTITTASIVAKV